ncbi:MAG: TonB-dependent receptor, partial [Deltaproteobacteria bacterium]|nr:TonB-dependent receptor [Deltaproteobacteria bacterium]
MKRSSWVLPLFLLLLPSQALAQEDKRPPGSPVTMDEVVVTGTRSEEKVERIPANVTVIDQEDIKNSSAKNVPDLLRAQEGIVVRDLLANGKSAQVDLRGFGEAAPYNNLVLVDGRRVNEIDLSGVDWTQIPLDQIERIEIVRGTGTVLYGDNAVGGVINIITKTPSDRFAFSAGATAGSYGRNKEHVSVSGGQGPLAASFYGSYDSTHGYRENNDYRAKDVGGKLVYDAASFLSLNVSGSYHTDDYGLPGPLTKDQLSVNRRASLDPLDKAETEDGYLKLGSDVFFGNWGNLVTDLSYRNRDSKSDFPDSLFPYVIDSQIETYGFTPRYIHKSDVMGHKNTLITGVDFYWIDQDLKTYSGFLSSSTTLTGLADISRDSYGLYVNDDFSVLENLILTLGARHEKVEYDLHQRDLSAFPLAPLDETVEESENAYTAGLTWLYSGKSALFGRYNRSFRFPLTDELVLFDYVAGRIRVNPDLKPQTGDHYEVGARHFFTPYLQANITLYRAEIKDEIFFNKATFTNENYDQTLHQGIEVGAKADFFEWLTLYGNYAYEKATFRDGPFDGKDIPAVPRTKFNLGFRIHDVIPNLVFSADYFYVAESFLISDQANRFEKLESYYTINLRLSYAWKWLNLFAGVNNVTQQKYSEYGLIGGFTSTPYYYPAP